MKRLSILIFTLVLIFSCKENHPKNYLTFSGKISNNKDSILTIADRQGIVKKIKIDKEGNFKDTLKVKNGAIYTLIFNNNNRTLSYLKNGYNLTLNTDLNNFSESLKYTGLGSSNSNFILAQLNKSQSVGNPQSILNLKEKDFYTTVKKLEFEFDSIINSYKDLDTVLYNNINKQNKNLITYLNTTFEKNKNISKGKPSPKFVDYLDIKGGKKSLESFKGKYVYIDVWATWCGPCIQQIPYLKALEKEYENKNIVFISISTDEFSRSGGSWEAAEKKWRDFVIKRNLSGVQLWSGIDNSFQQAYNINSIPRFLLIDPEGNIVSSNAPRPSQPSLKTLFSSLGI